MVFITIVMLSIVGNTQDNTALPKKGFINGVDTRVDNMGYWMDKAEKGLVPYNVKIPVKPAIFKSSKISIPGVKTTNSPDIAVSDPAGSTQSENSIFVDPSDNTYVLNSNNSTPNPVAGIYGANYFQSADAGITWGGTVQGAGGSNSGDPTTAIGLGGRQFINYISSASGQGIAYSDDGISWSTAIVAPNPGSLADKNHMWIDNSPTSAYEGNLYVAWTPFGGSDDAEIVISRSTDDGLTWSAPLNISSAVAAGSHNQGVNIQTGPNGEVYVTWAIYDGWPTDEAAMGFAKSTDGGATYSAATRIISNIRGIRTTETAKNHRVNSFPSMACDISGGTSSGNLYLVWANVGTPGINTGTNISVYMIRSTNGGTSWSTPTKVNQNAFEEGKEAYMPWICSDPETGVIATVFYDDRNTTSSSCEAFSAYSADAGNTWVDFQVSDVSFTPAAIPGLASSYMGDYLSIAARGGMVYPCWTDNRNGYMTYVSPYELGLNAGFAADDTEVCTGTSVTFSELSTGDPISWNWSFPGGIPASYNGQNPPAIAYNTPGLYDVSLTVSDGAENDTETKTGYITVKNIIADFSGTPQSVVKGNSVTFTDLSSCSPTSWSWSFPGGSPASFNGQNPPAIQYDTEGAYDVSLTVSNGSGNDTKTETAYITVVPPEFNMQNGTVTTCEGNFYDSGGPTSAYANNEDFVLTFYSSAAGAQIEFIFSQFDVEAQTDCNYDYLNIYNGENTSAPLIGQYCGTNSPGTVTSSNSAGAITFEWHSDVSVTGTGWTASIGCSTSPPVADFAASNTSPAPDSDVVFTDLSTSGPTAWTWTITPATYSFVNGTNASSQNPEVQFADLTAYTVSLAVSNPYGSDSETKLNYINVISCVYCPAEGNTGDEEWISNVTFNTIDNSSVAGTGYTDYTSISTDVDPGSTHDVSISCGSTGTWTENCWVFFDWNQDCDFDDAGESYDLGETSGPGTLTTSVTVPVDAVAGTVRMRAFLKYSSDPTDACEDGFSYGEVEDYTVNVSGGDIELELKVLLEGPFDGNEMRTDLNSFLPLSQPFNIAPWNYAGTENVGSIPNGDIVEWVLVDLRDAVSAGAASSGTSIAKQAAFIKNDGAVVGLDGDMNLEFDIALTNNLYVVIWQRNHIGIISNNALTPTGDVYIYNYTSGVNQVLGGIAGHKELAPGVWGMFSGDGDQNGNIGPGDKSATWGNQAGTKGYIYSDYNLDSESNNIDKDEYWLPNNGKGSQVPN